MIASNKLYLVPDADLYMFGVMMSNVHMAWTRVVCGRLKSDYSYSPAVYNNFPWPKPTEEQKKIGDYFRSLDNLITLHQCRYDELKQMKKYMLQNMFPKKG